ncbi:3D domain-containing protein [Terrisporobacter sp.]|uniref:3D domain-containing protein n=1 Tax=Terrisporobacter sp. TaxID=1965305 RepID=UPI00261C23BC|nr:3D domain-containing protein [Terrisporobacter sp.]
MSYINRKLKSILLSGLLSMGIVTVNYVAFNKEVVLVVDGQEIEVNSFQSNVQGVLDENEIDYDENDIISEDLDKTLEDGMKIEIKKVERRTITETDDIPFETVEQSDSSLLKGSTKIAQEGKKGTKELIYEAIYYDGKLFEKKLVEENILRKPENKIVLKGTKEKSQPKSDNSTKSIKTSTSTSSKSSLGTKMVVQATAYSGDGITSTGTVPKWGTIAVDPKVIPYGTKVYIPQFGQYFIAEDCGGAIKGNKIDIFMNSESQCVDWGRRTIDIYIVK